MRLASIRGWFDPRGRVSQPAYVRLVPRLLLLFVGALCAVVGIASLGLRALSIVCLAGPLGLALAAFAQTIRRLHDRGRSGWWLALYLALLAINALPIERGADAYPILVTGYALASLAVSLWFLVETLGRRGNAGANRHGPAPDAAQLGPERASTFSPQ